MERERGYDKQRIEFLRLGAFGCKFDYGEFDYLFLRSLKERGRDRAYALRVGDAVYDMYANAEVFIGERELIVGRIACRDFTESERTEYGLLREYAARTAPAMPGQASHMTIDYDLLLNKGALGIISDIRLKRSRLDLTDPGGIERDNFYASCIRALEGLIRFAERYSEKAEQQASQLEERGEDAARAAELREISANLRNVPANPASGFYEALQSAHFVTFCLSGKPFMAASHLYQLGRPDRYLLPFYEKDISDGKITPFRAQTLLDCFAILLNTRIPNGLAAGYMVGGSDENGRVVSNDLTRMAMDVIRHIRLIYPGVGYCWRPDSPPEDLRLACEILGEGHSHPAIFNDAVISAGLRRHGLSVAESYNYIHSTCVEITPIASSNVWVASPYMNLAQKLLDALVRDYASMDDLLGAYYELIETGIKENLVNETRGRAERRRYALDPLLSCFVNDCLEIGADIEAGGARYNWIMPSFVGLSNAADSLHVIEKLIFENKELDFATLRAALANDFEGYETLLRKIQNTVVKYGNDDDEADKYVLKLTEWLLKTMEKYQKRRENYLVPSLFCWIMHDRFGLETGASPDGRRAGFPLGDGSGPAQGREITGPTAAILSATKWEHEGFIGGIAVNMKFSKKMFGPGSADKLIALIRTYMGRGGFELQINVVDRETLEKAQNDPDGYKDLVVRVGGYSDYFVKLSPTMQREVLARTEYQL